MSESPGVIKSFRLKPGTTIYNYRIKNGLGRGFEAEVYEAIKIPTGVKRAFKIYRIEETENWERVRAMARFFEKLSQTGAVARYFHLGAGFLPTTGEPIAFLVMQLIQGITLDRYLRTIKGQSAQRELEFLRLIAFISEKIGRIHKVGYAAGDIENLQNIIITPTGEPVFCDLEPGERGNPNRDFENDLTELRSLFDRIFPVRDRRELFDLEVEMVQDALEKPVTQGTMKKLATEFKYILEAFDKNGEIT